MCTTSAKKIILALANTCARNKDASLISTKLQLGQHSPYLNGALEGIEVTGHWVTECVS